MRTHFKEMIFYSLENVVDLIRWLITCYAHAWKTNLPLSCFACLQVAIWMPDYLLQKFYFLGNFCDNFSAYISSNFFSLRAKLDSYFVSRGDFMPNILFQS